MSTTTPSPVPARSVVPAILGALIAQAVISGVAYGQVSMSVAPIRVEHAVDPGQAKTDVIMVENTGARPLRLRLTMADWYLRSDAPTFVKAGTYPAFSMSDWVEVNPTEVEVPAGATQVIRYTVTVPVDARAGGYRTAILVQSLPDFEALSPKTAAYLTARVGVILYNRVGLVEPRPVVVAQEIFTAPESPGQTYVRLVLRNSSAMYYRVKGVSRILSPSQEELQLVRVPDSVVLPDSERAIVFPIDEPLEVSDFTVVSHLDVGQPEILEVSTHFGISAAER